MFIICIIVSSVPKYYILIFYNYLVLSHLIKIGDEKEKSNMVCWLTINKHIITKFRQCCPFKYNFVWEEEFYDA